MKLHYLLAFMAIFSTSAIAQDVVHYWHFNNVSGTVDTVEADFHTGTNAPLLIYRAAYPNVTNQGYMDNVSGDALNARFSEPAGEGIRPRNPSDSMELYIELPTTGFENIQVSYAVQRSGSGMLEQVISYTTDGSTFTAFDTIGINTAWTLETFDFSSIAGADDNADFAIKIHFLGQNTASNGNNRIDNLVLSGDAINTTLDVIHYWHFNNVSGTVDSVEADVFAGTTAPWLYYQPAFPNVTGGGYMDNVSGDALNARFSEPAGEGIRPRNPSDSMELYIELPTTGFENIQVSYAVQRSGSGMLEQVISYTTDGSTFIAFDTIGINTAWTLETFDFSSIAGADDNADFAIKIHFLGQNTASNGNNRIDNLVLEGISLGGAVADVMLNANNLTLLVADTSRLMATIIPANATNQDVSWSSLDATIATVDADGLVTAVTVGSTHIVVTTVEGGFTDTCEVNVVPAANLTFEVMDANGPIANAMLEIAGDTQMTDAQGVAMYALLPGMYQAEIIAQGYFAQTNNYNILGDTTIQVMMTPTSAVIHYWHFNNLPIGTVTSVGADYTLTPQDWPIITYEGTSTGYMDDYSPGSALNTQFNEPAGVALRVRNRSEGRALIIPLPAQECEDIFLSFDIHRSGQGMLTNHFEYTLDGGQTYSDVGVDPQEITVTTDYVTHVIDFSAVTGANNNPDFGVRITWTGNTEQDNGNNRYDNITMMASTTLSTPELTAMRGARLFPNPTTGMLYLQDLPEGQYEYQIVNLQGQVVAADKLNSTDATISLHDRLSNGMYMLMIKSLHGTATHKFILNR